MSLGKEQELFSRDLILLQVYIINSGYEIRQGEGLRTEEQQAIHISTGKSKVKRSRHQDKLAKDYFLFKDGQWIQDKQTLQHIFDFWERLNPQNRAGGNWSSFYDPYHFERLA